MRRINLIVISLLVGVCALAIPLLLTGESRSDAVEPAAPEWVVSAALHRSELCEVERPTQVEWGLMDTASLASVLGRDMQLLPADDEAAKQYVVVIARGDFRFESAHLPPGAPVPAGTWFVLVMDPDSRETHTFGLGEGDIDTAAVAELHPVSL